MDVGRRTLNIFYSFLPDSLWDDFLQVFHIFRGRIMMLHIGAFSRNMSRQERFSLEYAVQNLFHPKREAVGLGETGDF